MKKALITGITGQDGSYLAELLLGKGYLVWGMVRRSSQPNTALIEHLLDNPVGANLELVFGDLSDSSSILKLIQTLQPDEVYNLAAQSHVKVSFDIPEYTTDVGGLGPLRLLEGLREFAPGARFYQASSSEMFGEEAW